MTHFFVIPHAPFLVHSDSMHFPKDAQIGTTANFCYKSYIKKKLIQVIQTRVYPKNVYRAW